MPDRAHYHRRGPLLKKRGSLVYTVQILIDLLLTATLLLVLTYLKFDEIPSSYRILLVTALLIQLIVYSVSGVYRRSGSWMKGCYRLSLAWAVFILLLVFVGFITKASAIFSREIFLLWVSLGFVMQIAAYCLMSQAMTLLRGRFVEKTPCLVVGEGRLADYLQMSINTNKWLPDQIVGYVSADSFGQPVESIISDFTSSIKPSVKKQNALPVLGDLSNIKMLVTKHQVRRIYIAVPLTHSGQVEGLHIELLDMNVDLIWVPDIFALKLLNHSIREVAGLPLIFLNESPMTSTRTGIFVKALMDRSISLLLLLFLSPLFLIIAFLIKRSSTGPVFFKQDRHGWDGKVFKIWKFRSMRMHKEDSRQVTQATKGDSRITRIGAFIRKTSIDELPQLFNVLLGEMSLVGPRPHAIAHNDYYDGHIEAYLLRHRIKPGITGLAQINGCRGETEVVDKMRERVRYDVEYINNWSLWLDVRILIKTPFTLFSNDIY